MVRERFADLTGVEARRLFRFGFRRLETRFSRELCRQRSRLGPT